MKSPERNVNQFDFWSQNPCGADGDLNELEEIEVLGDPPADGGGRMIPIEDLPGLKSSIGSVEFSKQDIGDAAGAVSRVAGANIVDGRYAVIRGLGDRYSSTTVNGAIIPSSDPSKKAVQLDLFPTDLVQDLVISKTFTPSGSQQYTPEEICFIMPLFNIN